ncbi:TRAM/LAG1/CLN8 homology domain-containing protein [Dioscorea alata]|uniref:TRAM/LAG1/CLN8 homology domain-containing protein n=1 Tax=Dioscorea alata TaxID=55571 RepID=A0ACB7W0D1_DIOAL|nr:TRAM/LAG1/CLN8 homology domain-containing protein [Dioscorea alata]
MEALTIGSSMFPTFFLMFCLIYLIGRFIVFRNWSMNQRREASSCFISLFHGTPAVFLATSAILTHPSWGFAFPNTNFDNLVLDYSIAYFTVDLLHYLILIPGDYLFIAHHLATLFVFVTCRYLVLHGAFALLVLLVLAEVTSPWQNVWTLARIRKTESVNAARLDKLLSFPFYSLYTLMRVIAGPLFFFKMSAYYLSGQANDVIPNWVSVSWIVVVGAAIGVSILWISNLWIELYKETIGSSEKKER